LLGKKDWLKIKERGKMKEIIDILKDNASLLKDEYHLCCYDPAMWLEKGAV
jgi:hypothetical protein